MPRCLRDMRLVFLVRELLVNHVQVCTSRQPCCVTLQTNTKCATWLFQPFYKKVMKNTHSQHKDNGLTLKMTENTTLHLQSYIWVVNKHYVHAKHTNFSQGLPPPLNILFRIIQYEWQPHSIYIREQLLIWIAGSIRPCIVTMGQCFTLHSFTV